jgi:hypothetical protein
MKRWILLLFIAAILKVETKMLDRWLGRGRLSQCALAIWSVANVVFMTYLWYNHAAFPLHLDLMEGTIVQHFQRAASLQPVYPAPAADYVSLAYNPLYYYLAVPFSWFLGVNVFTLRVVAIFGMLGSAVCIFVTVRQKTRSFWWGLLGIGLFAAAYRVMDTYLDNAHSDSWFLCSALWGTFILDQRRSRLSDLSGVLLLVSSFWFKQHGALFAIGGLAWLTWSGGLRAALPCWIAATVAGPILYVGLGSSLFGSHFHYFTWQVPSRWSRLDLRAVARLVRFVGRTYPFLAISSLAFALLSVWKLGRRVDIWHVQLLIALSSGLMGALDSESANNVFIPMGTWFIVVGVIGLQGFLERIAQLGRWKVDRFALAASFIPLLYDPRSVIVSPSANVAFVDFTSFLAGLGGNVYAPTIGQLESGYVLRPAAHWAPLDDMVRGPGREVRHQHEIRRLLESALHPAGRAYLLTHHRLEAFPVIDFLGETYSLETDLGSRFEALRVLPKRYDHGWPRYLYVSGLPKRPWPPSLDARNPVE